MEYTPFQQKQLIYARYRRQTNRLSHNDVPQNIISKLCKQQNLLNNKFTDTPSVDQVVKAREIWIHRDRASRSGKGNIASDEWQV